MLQSVATDRDKVSTVMAVARNAVEELELCASAGCDEYPIVSSYKGLVVKLVIVRIQPELRRTLVARATASIRVIWRGDRPVRIPAAAKAHHAHDLGGLEASA